MQLFDSFTNPSKVSARVTMDSPTGSTVEIRHDHGFNSSIVAKVTNANNSRFTIRQVKMNFAWNMNSSSLLSDRKCLDMKLIF